jgi:hypothetical protein
MKYEFRIEFEEYPTSYGLFQNNKTKKTFWKIRGLYFILTALL